MSGMCGGGVRGKTMARLVGALLVLLVEQAAAGMLTLSGPQSIGMVATSPAAAAFKLLPAQRYVATNRFRVRESREAAFEKRWADRKSRLGLLEGFRFFCMMRRVDNFDGTPYEDDINYISCTVWEKEENFDAWKTGDAFKEAHGGGTVGGIASMLLATAMNTKGKPKAAMWEAILPVTMPPSTPTSSDSGWREVVADGENMLDAEAFIAMNRFSVLPGMEATFESRFASRESTLSEYDGFKGFLLLRRDGPDPDGFTHSTWSAWRDRAAFDAWRTSENRSGKLKDKAPEGEKPARAGPPSIYARPPVPTFYDGILVLESEKGV